MVVKKRFGIIICVLASIFLIDSVHAASCCAVTAQTQAGRVCGLVINKRLAVFRGVPYAEQPVGPLRFKELQPLKPWKGTLNATVQGPVCPQVDRTFGALIKPLDMSEACIHANIHTPLSALSVSPDKNNNSKLPVLVFISGGGFQSGSGDPDMYGPEYFVDRNVVMITFNYRLNVFGFLSLNTSDVPGNQGLRDIITMLRWVRDNVHHFGGNPDNVTLMGQSVGSSNLQLVAMSPVSKGLYKRLIMSSGTALPAYFTTSPIYAKKVANMLLDELKIDNSDPKAAFKELTELPIETILAAYDIVQNETGLVTFAAVKESGFEGVTTVISEDPSVLTLNGAFNNLPLLIGFNAKNECRFFQNRIQDLKYIDILKKNLILLLSSKLTYSSENQTNAIAEVEKHYFDGEITYDGFIKLCSQSFFEYPIMKLVQIRAKSGKADTFLYRFAYEGEFRTIIKGLELDSFEGVAHVEDLSYIFRTNSVFDRYPPQITPTDDRMRTSWIDTIINFMTCSRPICGNDAKKWLPVSKDDLAYHDVKGPGNFQLTQLSDSQREMINLFDRIGALF